jgi:hypothetical protein
MAIKPLPQTDDDERLVGCGTEIGTFRVEAVDPTTGADVTVPVDCKEIEIVCDEGAGEWSFSGTLTGVDAKVLIGVASLKFSIAVEAGTVIGKVYGGTAASSFSVVLTR